MDAVLETSLLAMVSVCLWTLRVAITARGRRVLGALVAAVEATVFAVAFSRLLSGLDTPALVAGYGVGVAGGTLVGLAVDRILNPQSVRVEVVDTDGVLAAALREEGWNPTSTPARAATGPVEVVTVAMAEQALDPLVRRITEIAPAALWTVTQLRRPEAPEPRRVPPAEGWRRPPAQVGGSPGCDRTRLTASGAPRRRPIAPRTPGRR